MTSLYLFFVLILILLTAFFVASEFAIVKVRRTRIEYLEEQGDPRARMLRHILDHLDGYLSACQLGITVTALGIGWIGEPAFAVLLTSLFGYAGISGLLSHTLAAIVAFLIITYLHVVLGELAPKTFAIQKAETIALFIARPLVFFKKMMFPFIWLLNGSANVIARLFGVHPAGGEETAHSEEELRYILSDSYESGEINQAEYRYVNKIFEFDDRMAKEIMVPRTEIVTLYKENSVAENFRIMREEKFTRYPVAEKDKDHIVGLVNIKELFQKNRDEIASLDPYIRPIITVIETTPIKQLLVKMQKERIHMAILMDEYGGTAGLVTVEDILEEIVGEIRDEFDADERPMIERLDENRTILNGKVLISDVNDMYGLEIDDSELDTIGGWILTKTTDAEVGSEFVHEGLRFKVLETDGHQIKQIEVVDERGRQSETVSVNQS